MKEKEPGVGFALFSLFATITITASLLQRGGIARGSIVICLITTATCFLSRVWSRAYFAVTGDNMHFVVRVITSSTATVCSGVAGLLMVFAAQQPGAFVALVVSSAASLVFERDLKKLRRHLWSHEDDGCTVIGIGPARE